MQAQLDEAWRVYRAAGGTSDAYREHYASLVEAIIPENPITIEDFVKLEGKELQEEAPLARAGHEVRFRNPDVHRGKDGNTSDAAVDGELCDFKNIESASLSKMTKRVTEKLDRQGPMFLVDLSRLSVSQGAAEIRLAKLCDDKRIKGFFLVAGGTIREIRK